MLDKVQKMPVALKFILAFTAIFIVVFAVVSVFYYQSFSAKPQPTELIPTQVIDINRNSETANLTLQDPITPTSVPSYLGTIEGIFNFPSEGIPQTMRACAQNTVTEEVTCSPTLIETGLTNSFSFYVSPGTYYVYAQNGTDAEAPKAYYTEFVPCGLLASCTSHEKIPVKVKAGETVSDILPHDWYN